MAASLEIGLLGGFRLLYAGRPVDGCKPPRQQALLAYLVLHRRLPQPREHLAYLLWPDTSEEQALTNLRKQIHFLRRSLPEPETFLRVEGGEIQWREGSPFILDVAEFETAIATGCLEKAANLYTGDLLPGCYEDWILVERERLKQLYSDALGRMVQKSEAAGDYASAISHIQHLLRREPLREEIHRHLIRLHARNGDRAAALQAYMNCETILKRELNVEPGAATQEAYALLLDRQDHFRPPLPLAGQFPLIGRASEWACLQGAWRQAANGMPGLVLLRGEAGIGKTRLSEELLVWADRQGVTTASAHCYAAEGALAYGPVADWLRGRPLPALEPVWLTEIARLLPEICNRQPALPPPGPLTEAWQRRRFHEALARAVLGPGLSQDSPLLLLIEDLQWCDRDTLEWLHYLLRFDQRARLLVAGSLRVETDLSDHPLSPLLSDCRRWNILTEIDLRPLSLEETTCLGTQVLGRGLDPETAASLYGETEGNPLFIVEYSRANLVQASKERSRGPVQTLPPAIHAAIVDRISNLSSPARHLVELAAVVGREFTFGVLLRASDLNEKALVQALDELWRHRLIREQGQAAYDFSHDKLRQVVYQGISFNRRRWLHRQVANALAGIHASHPQVVIGRIGWHYEQAGENRSASEWFRQAAEVATRTGSSTDSLAFSRRALELLPPEDPRRAELLYNLGTALIVAGDYAPAFETLEQAKDLARECADFKIGGRALAGMSDVVSRRGFNQEAAHLAEEALALARQADDQENISNVLRLLGRLAYYRREYSQAHKHLNESLAILENLENPYDQARCLNNLGVNYMDQGEYAEAMQSYEQAYEICKARQFRVILSQVTHNMGWTAFLQGKDGLARRYQEEAHEYAGEIDDHSTLCVILNALGHIALRRGDLSQAEAYYRDGLLETRHIRPTPVSLESLAGLAGVWVQTRPFPQAAERAAELFGLALGSPQVSPEVRCILPLLTPLLEAALPPEGLKAAMERGRNLDLDRTVEEILQLLGTR
jgi:DNA-binding SARP family transcriptional activator